MTNGSEGWFFKVNESKNESGKVGMITVAATRRVMQRHWQQAEDILVRHKNVLLRSEKIFLLNLQDNLDETLQLSDRKILGYNRKLRGEVEKDLANFRKKYHTHDAWSVHSGDSSTTVSIWSLRSGKPKR